MRLVGESQVKRRSEDTKKDFRNCENGIWQYGSNTSLYHMESVCSQFRMSDKYVREILRKCVAMICEKCKVTHISNIGVDVLADVAIFRISLILDMSWSRYETNTKWDQKDFRTTISSRTSVLGCFWFCYSLCSLLYWYEHTEQKTEEGDSYSCRSLEELFSWPFMCFVYVLLRMVVCSPSSPSSSYHSVVWWIIFLWNIGWSNENSSVGWWVNFKQGIGFSSRARLFMGISKSRIR